jgi:hypothetical protein
MRSASPSGRGPLTASQTYRNPETRVQHLVRDHGPAIRVTEALSRVASIDRLMSLGLFPIGSAVAGPAAAVFGVRVPLVARRFGSLGRPRSSWRFPASDKSDSSKPQRSTELR